jgi:hypothetical protein
VADADIVLPGWNAESFRLTFFEIINWTERPLFAELTETVAAQVVVQRPVQLHQETGPLGDALLSVVQQPGRLDIVLSDIPTRNTLSAALPGFRPFFWVGPYEESLATFDGICAKATSAIANAKRVAYSVTLINSTTSAQESLSKLIAFLPDVHLDPQNDSDFVFQINRPVRHEKHGLINRLGRWETLSTATILLGAHPSIGAAGAFPGNTAARIVADVSSDSLNTEPLTDLKALFGLLREQALEIAEKGDVR